MAFSHSVRTLAVSATRASYSSIVSISKIMGGGRGGGGHLSCLYLYLLCGQSYTVVLKLIKLITCHLSAKLNVNLLKILQSFKKYHSLSQMEILTVFLYTNDKLYWSKGIYFISRYFLLCHGLVDHLADKMYRDAGAVT
jgi:hypothetical protein